MSKETGEEYALERGLSYYETSAKTGEQVESLFEESSRRVVDKIDRGEVDPSNESLGIKQGGLRQRQEITVRKSQQKGKKCCAS